MLTQKLGVLILCTIGKFKGSDSTLGRTLVLLSGTHSVVRVEDVGGRRVVQDQSLVEVSAQTT